MQRFALPIVIAIAALGIGIGIGRYTASSTKQTALPPSVRLQNEPTTVIDPANPATLLPQQSPSRTKSNPATTNESAQTIIAKLKGMQMQLNSRRAYATLSKIVEGIDTSNARDVLAFVQTLPKTEEKSTLMSLVIGRWAELDPSAAVGYAQALPPGVSRNWALTSAVSGWAEHDPAAATAWVQQLTPGPLREQARQPL